MSDKHVTRGYGLLETYLAKRRARMADTLIPKSFKSGRILDIGCGTYPLFLINIDFNEKYGLDRSRIMVDEEERKRNGIQLTGFDLEAGGALPFEDGFFDIVTMLAVFEHIDPAKLLGVLNEIRRVLKPAGRFIMATPAGWTETLLKLMARLKLVSGSELSEHKDSYSQSKIRSIIHKSQFGAECRISSGYFELFMNSLTVVEK